MSPAPQFKNCTLEELRTKREKCAKRTGVLADPIMLNILDTEIAERTAPPLPSDPEQENERRSDQAEEVLNQYESAFGEAPYGGISAEQLIDLREQNLSDLICDFAHFCDRNGVDMQEVLRRAAMHYRDETSNEGTQFDRSSVRVVPDQPTKPLGLQMADDIASALMPKRSTSITLSPAEVLAVDLMGKQARAARGVTGFDDKHQAWVLNGVYVRCGHDPMMIACTCYGRLHEGEPVAADADIQ